MPPTGLNVTITDSVITTNTQLMDSRGGEEKVLNPLLSVSRQRTIIRLVLGRRRTFRWGEGIHSDEQAKVLSFNGRKEQERPLVNV